MYRVLILCLSLVAVHCSDATPNMFDGLWRTFSLALANAAPQLPLTVDDAQMYGWVQDKSTNDCTRGLGYQYFYNGSATPTTPVSLWYNSLGKVSGITVYAFGVEDPSIANLQFWRKLKSDVYFLSVGFRSSPTCQNRFDDGYVVGDQLVINPDTNQNYLLPVNEKDAYCDGWRQGSAMKTLGTHYFFHPDKNDVWNSSKLVPIGVMYYNGKACTFMFMTPVPQPGSYAAQDQFWDRPVLSPPLMCQNWCEDSTCNWPQVYGWSTLHIFLNSQWPSILPADNQGPPVYRSCSDVNKYVC